MKSVKIDRETWETTKHLGVDMDKTIGEVLAEGIKLLKAKFDKEKP